MLKRAWTWFKTVVVQRIKLYDRRKNRNGIISFEKDGWIKFKSNTETGMSPTDFRAKKCETMTHMFEADDTTSKSFSFKMLVERWVPMEYEANSQPGPGGVKRGHFSILCQLWNEVAAPRAYLTAQRKIVNGKLSEDTLNLYIQNKKDDGKTVTHHTAEIKIGEVVEVKALWSSVGFSYYINGVHYPVMENYLVKGMPTHLQFGLYNSGLLYKDIGLDEAAKRDLGLIIKFKDIEMKR